MEKILEIFLDSPYITIPNIAPPHAPIPVHTAYDNPIGNVFIASERKKKLNANPINIREKAFQLQSLCNLLIIATPNISQIPANIRILLHK